MRTMRSSGPQPAVGGSFGLAVAVMSIPITAKSPFASSQMSGQLFSAIVCLPFACGSGPILRRNSIGVFMLPNNRRNAGKMQEQNTSYSWFSDGHLSANLRTCGNSTSRTSQGARPGNSPLPQEGENDPGTAWRGRRPEFEIHRRGGAHGKDHFG